MCSPVTNSSTEAVEEWVFPGDGEKRKTTFPLFHTQRMDGEHSALSGVERERERLPPIYNSSPPAVRNPPFIFIYSTTERSLSSLSVCCTENMFHVLLVVLVIMRHIWKVIKIISNVWTLQVEMLDIIISFEIDNIWIQGKVFHARALKRQTNDRFLGSIHLCNWCRFRNRTGVCVPTLLHSERIVWVLLCNNRYQAFSASLCIYCTGSFAFNVLRNNKKTLCNTNHGN